MSHPSFTRTLLATAVAAALLAACGDGGGGNTPANPTNPTPPGPAVKIVSTESALDEGYDASHTVTLEAATTEPASYDFSVGGTASAADIGPMTFSDGVTHDAAAKKLNVPAGVKSFTIHYTATFDTVADAGETVELTVGGVSGKATLRDPADKYVGEWDFQMMGQECIPSSGGGVKIALVTARGGDSQHVDASMRYYVYSDDKCATLKETLPLVDIAGWLNITGTKDVDGYRADKAVTKSLPESGFTPNGNAVLSVRMPPSAHLTSMTIYVGVLKPVDADGYPEHFDASPYQLVRRTTLPNKPPVLP